MGDRTRRPRRISSLKNFSMVLLSYECPLAQQTGSYIYVSFDRIPTQHSTPCLIQASKSALPLHWCSRCCHPHRLNTPSRPPPRRPPPSHPPPTLYQISIRHHSRIGPRGTGLRARPKGTRMGATNWAFARRKSAAPRMKPTLLCRR